MDFESGVFAINTAFIADFKNPDWSSNISFDIIKLSIIFSMNVESLNLFRILVRKIFVIL